MNVGRLGVERAVGAAVFALGLMSACSSAGSSSSALGPDSTGTGPDGSAGVPPSDFADGGIDTSCTQCSPDLHSIVTCGDNPQVLLRCPDDQACGPNGCLPACEGAAANKSSIGCDYYAMPPDTRTETAYVRPPGACFAAFVTNNWNMDMKVTLVWKGNTIDATPFAYIPKGAGVSITYEPIPATGIPPNGMAIVFLNQLPKDDDPDVIKCPKKAAIENEDVATHGTGIGQALKIQTSVPAVVYDVYPFGGEASKISSASLLLPISVWDTNYVAATMSTKGADGAFPGGVNLVANEDGTEVTFLPTVDIEAGKGVSGATKGTPVVYKFNKGEIIHLQRADADLTGSIVESNKPIGVWGEHFCMIQPNPPTWRIVGAVDDTTLTYDPPVAEGPATLKKGELVEFNASGPFHITSQDDAHPFYLAAHRPGTDCDAAHQQIPPVKALGYDYVAVGNESSNYELGGPETVNVVPPAQFLTSYVFFTDPTYGYTELALVRKKVGGKFEDVSLDCLGVISNWNPVGTSGDYEFAHVRLRHAGLAQGACDNGRHTITSKTPFGITVWGYDSSSSYAYPAGASVRPINQVVVHPTVN